MIGYLKGRIIYKKPSQVLIDVNGVGYLINISLNTFEKLPDLEQQANLFTFLAVRDDALDLYGFSSQAEKEIFQLLISVSGIGPKLALNILSGVQIEDLYDAIRQGNISRIIAIPGVGRKTGERLIVELRDKIEKVGVDVQGIPGELKDIRHDAILALTNLGYNQKIADRAVRSALEENPSGSIEDLIKSALSKLNN